MSTAKEVLHHPRAWVYARGVSGSPALHERFDALRRSSSWEGTRSSAKAAMHGSRLPCGIRAAALLRAVRKGLVDDVFVPRLSQFSGKVGLAAAVFHKRGVCVHTTEIELRYDLYRHGLDSALL